MKQLLGPVHIQTDNLTSALKNGDKSYRCKSDWRPSLILKMFLINIGLPKSKSFNPLVPELFGRARNNLIFHRGIEHYRFILFGWENPIATMWGSYVMLVPLGIVPALGNSL